MNYPGMRLDILTLFRDAQSFSIDRVHALWVKRQAEKSARERAREREEYYRHKALFGYKGKWRNAPPVRAKVVSQNCPLCGGLLEQREGFALGRFVHVGLCRRPAR